MPLIYLFPPFRSPFLYSIQENTVNPVLHAIFSKKPFFTCHLALSLNVSCISNSLPRGSLSHYLITCPSAETVSPWKEVCLFHLCLSATLHRPALSNLSWTLVIWLFLVSDDTFRKDTQKNYWSFPTPLETEKGAWSAGPHRKYWNDKRKKSQAFLEQRSGHILTWKDRNVTSATIFTVS